MSGKRLAAVLATLAVAGGAASACGEGGPGGVTGTYNLQTVNGNSLPAVLIQIGNDKVEITAGSVTLNSDDSFTFRITLRETVSGNVTTETETSVGTYSVTGNQISFSDSDGDDFIAVLAGGTITFVDEGVSLVFQK